MIFYYCRLREKKLSWVDIFEEIPVCTLVSHISVVSMNFDALLMCPVLFV
jgi:hypothetical protein